MLLHYRYICITLAVRVMFYIICWNKVIITPLSRVPSLLGHTQTKHTRAHTHTRTQIHTRMRTHTTHIRACTHLHHARIWCSLHQVVPYIWWSIYLVYTFLLPLSRIPSLLRSTNSLYRDFIRLPVTSRHPFHASSSSS
jgi:hypothetical protein